MDSNRRKIMLVDDNQSILRQGKRILDDLYEVYPLPSTGKMFGFLEKVIPDLILLNIRMPEIDGFEAIKSLKSDERYAPIPVIFTTDSHNKANETEGFSLGAVDFITKPFSAPDLLKRIKKCLSTSGRMHLQENEGIINENIESEDVEVKNEDIKNESIKDDKPVILAVDDSPDILKAVHSILHDKYKVYTLPRPEKLQDILRDIKPVLFLLDYKMPELSGFDLIPIIRGFPEHEDTPIIFLTSERTIDHVTAAVGLGACDFIVKPFKVDVLREKIAKHII